MSETVSEETVDEPAGDEEVEVFFYRIQFREGGQQSTAVATISGLLAGTAVMVQTDHGLEPAHIARYSATVRLQRAKSSGKLFHCPAGNRRRAGKVPGAGGKRGPCL